MIPVREVEDLDLMNATKMERRKKIQDIFQSLSSQNVLKTLTESINRESKNPG